MDRTRLVSRLTGFLLEERGETRENGSHDEQRNLLQALLTLRPPARLPSWFLRDMDTLLQREREEMQLTHPDGIPGSPLPGIKLWQGDITTLQSDGIVNAANEALLGCFQPFHSCIDNAIHSRAGPGLREECSRIMDAQGHPEPTGAAKVTAAYNLPCRYVLHTVGPIIRDGSPTAAQGEELSSCYRSCLDLAASQKDLQTLAFCCIATGVFGYPNRDAAEIALRTTVGWLKEHPGRLTVILNVFRNEDREIYESLLEARCAGIGPTRTDQT